MRPVDKAVCTRGASTAGQGRRRRAHKHADERVDSDGTVHRVHASAVECELSSTLLTVYDHYSLPVSFTRSAKAARTCPPYPYLGAPPADAGRSALLAWPSLRRHV